MRLGDRSDLQAASQIGSPASFALKKIPGSAPSPPPAYLSQNFLMEKAASQQLDPLRKLVGVN